MTRPNFSVRLAGGHGMAVRGARVTALSYSPAGNTAMSGSRINMKFSLIGNAAVLGAWRLAMQEAKEGLHGQIPPR